MRRLLSAAAFVLTTLLVAGCGPEMHYVASDPTVRAPKPREYDMPFSYEAPDRPHKVLGELRISEKIQPSYKTTSTFDRILFKMRERAIDLGADAIVSLKTLDSQNGGSEGRLTLVGTLVIYTAPPPLSSVNR